MSARNPSPAWSCSNGETLAGMQRQGGARRYSRVKRAVENRKKRDREMFRFCRFSGIGCGKGCLSCGVIQQGRFCPCGEWRGDRFYHPVVSYGLIEPYLSPSATNTVIFFENWGFFRKRNVSLSEILSVSYHGQQFVDVTLPSDNLSSDEHGISYSWVQAK